MKTDPELWRNLKVGDRVRMIEIPAGFFGTLHAETKQAYKYLLKRRRPLTVSTIDEFGLPWVQFRRQGRLGRMEYHWMALNHGGIVLVKPRRVPKK